MVGRDSPKQGSTLNPYSSLTWITRSANHAPCLAGIHSAGVPVTFFRPVHRRIRDRQVVEVTGNVPAPIVGDAAVVRLRQRHDVLDVRRRCPVRRDVKREARVGGVDLPVRLHCGRQRRDDLALQAAVARPESVAVVAVPRSLIADLQPAPRLRVPPSRSTSPPAAPPAHWGYNRWDCYCSRSRCRRCRGHR